MEPASGLVSTGAGTERTARVHASASRRVEWLVLAGADGFPARTGHPAAPVLRVVTDPRAFRTALVGERPRLAVVHVPPGGATDIDLLAAERQRRQSLRAVLVNGRGCVSERLDALRLGLDEAFGDDVDRSELLERLRILAESSRGGRSEHRLTIADGMVLDLDARQLRRDGGPIHLRPKEFGLLEALLRHRGRTFTRRQLLDLVWGRDHDGDERTVDVHVRWLRQKLEVDPDRPLKLLTVRGVGYRLVPSDR